MSTSPAPPTPRELSAVTPTPLDTLAGFRAMLEQALQEGVGPDERAQQPAVVGTGLFDDDEDT